MDTHWGWVKAKKEAEQARDKERILHESLVDLIKAVEIAVKDLQSSDESRQVQKKLIAAVNKAKRVE